MLKHLNESVFVNGVEVTAVYSENAEFLKEVDERIENCKTFGALLEKCDAVYLVSVPQQHEEQIRKAIDAGKHVLVESPIATNPEIVRNFSNLQSNIRSFSWSQLKLHMQLRMIGSFY